MSLFTSIAVPNRQRPVPGESVTALREIAVQQINAEPAPSTPEEIENGAEENVTQPNQGA